MREPELALAWGVLIAGFAQLFFQLPFLRRINLLASPKRSKSHEGVARIKKLMLPALFGVSVTQINLMLDVFIASLLATGSISWLYYLDRLMELPLGTFVICLFYTSDAADELLCVDLGGLSISKTKTTSL